MFSAIRSQHRGVDICINNAGLARPDTLLSGSTNGWKDMFNVRAADREWGAERTVGSPEWVSQSTARDGTIARRSFGFLPGTLSSFPA